MACLQNAPLHLPSTMFHLQRRNSCPSINWIENDMICVSSKSWYILIKDISRLLNQAGKWRKDTKDKEAILI